MRRCCCLCQIISLCLLSYARGQEDHWENIKRFQKADTEQSAVEYEEYIQSLGAEGLIQAAKQCCAEIETSFSPEDWDVSVGMLGFFYKNYPVFSDNLRKIAPLLDSMEDEAEGLCWRYCLMQLLGVEWRDKLDVNTAIEVSDKMSVICRDISEPVLLKPKALRLCNSLLLIAYQKNLIEDPAVRAFVREDRGHRLTYVKEVQSGKLKLSKNTVVLNDSILKRINESTEEQLEMFSSEQTSTTMKEQIIVAWGRYREYNLDHPQVSPTLTNAVDNYKNYDEKLWFLLAKTAIEDFGDQNANHELQEMIREASDDVLKARLIYLDKKVEKAKR